MKRAVLVFAFLAWAGTRLCEAQIETRAPERAHEIDAKCWFNAQPVRIHGAPRLILLEFWSARSRESREFGESLSGLYRAYRDAGSLLIVALTEDDCEDARNFIHREKIEYKIGAESRSGKDYGVKELPAVILIDPKESRIVARWAGREVKVKPIARAIQDFLGPPPGMVPSGALSPEEQQTLPGNVAAKGDELGDITSQILAVPGEIAPETLSARDRFFEANLCDETIDNAVTRAQRFARCELMMSEDAGYEKLFAGGRLGGAAKAAIRDRVLQIAEKDASAGVRIRATHALRKYAGRPADAALLEALRGLSEREQEPLVKAALDHALEDLGPDGAAKRRELALRPTNAELQRMLNQSPNPATSPWADAHAYKQTLSQRSAEQLAEDYAAFRDPLEDEIGRQNATLKRWAALDQLDDRIKQGTVRDLRVVKDHLARALSEEPDPSIRKYIVWEALQSIAQRGESGLRTEIIGLLESCLSVESDRYVRATIDTTIQELKKP